MEGGNEAGNVGSAIVSSAPMMALIPAAVAALWNRGAP